MPVTEHRPRPCPEWGLAAEHGTGDVPGDVPGEGPRALHRFVRSFADPTGVVTCGGDRCCCTRTLPGLQAESLCGGGAGGPSLLTRPTPARENHPPVSRRR